MQYSIMLAPSVLQAVVADQIQGDTLHHTAGITFGIGNRSVDDRNKASRNMSMMRWLVIDEVSQVSAELYAQCESQLSRMVQAQGTYKRNLQNKPRPWAGMNVILVGDFMQLPPVRGTELCTLPRDLMNLSCITNPVIQHGLDLFWTETTAVLELTQQQRCDDPWWMTVLDEMRHGRMTETNHAFLHGERTVVPGAWLSTKQSVDPQVCSIGCVLATSECIQCKNERTRRCRVYQSGIAGTRDSRLHSKKFRHAVSVVANNGIL
jgi:hypothetical protein